MEVQILFDLDNTLLESRRLSKYIIETLIERGVPEVVAQETLDSFVREHNGNYDLTEHLRMIHEQGLPLFTVNDIVGPDISSFLTKGSAEVLEELQERGYQLSLVTKGIESFQREKIKRAGLERFFKDIYVVEDKKEEVLKKFKGLEDVWVVNDHWQETERLIKDFPEFRYVLYVRPDAKDFYDSKDVTCLTVDSLQELIPLVSK